MKYYRPSLNCFSDNHISDHMLYVKPDYVNVYVDI